jgi:hypothetical protein
MGGKIGSSEWKVKCAAHHGQSVAEGEATGGLEVTG